MTGSYDLAIDFGTTATAAATRGDGEEPRLFSFSGGAASVPSAVFRRPPDARLGREERVLVGEHALARLQGEDAALGERTPKRLIRHPEGVFRLGTEDLPVVSIVSWVLRDVYREVEHQLGGPPRRVALTCPVAWASQRRKVLSDAARAAGIPGEPVLVSEPEAAARHLGSVLGQGEKLAVYDLGGGTCDIAVLKRVGGELRTVVHGDQLQNEEMIGGETFDADLLAHLLGELERDGDRTAEAASILRKIHNDHRWAGDGSLDAAQVGRWRRCWLRFGQGVRLARELLSHEELADITLQDPAPETNFEVTRPDLEKLITPRIAPTIETLQACIEEAGGIDHVYLVGGASATPLVERLAAESTGREPRVANPPKGAVVLGAILALDDQADTESSGPRTTVGPNQGRHMMDPSRRLELVFSDQPDLLRIVTSRDLEDQHLLVAFRERDDLLAEPVKQYTVGRTLAGKTTLGNKLFGDEVMSSTGKVDCTENIGLLKMRSNLYYIDTPGAGGLEEMYENWARLALGLPQLEEGPADALGVWDYTGARRTVDGKVEGEVRSEFTAQEWEHQLSSAFAPDVVVYVVAPHMGFLRPDRDFLTAVLRRHGPKVVIALNDWAELTKDIQRENSIDAITAVYRKLFPDGSVRPRFARVNALTGAGMSELTSEICRVVAPEKLGSMQEVLSGDLKQSALTGRSRRYRDTVNRIAARLALHTVDHKAGDQDLIAAAAEGVCRYGVLTFEATDLADAFQQEMAMLLESQVEAVKQQRQEEIKVQVPQHAPRDITVDEPEYEDLVSETTETRQVPVEVQEPTGVGFSDVVDAYIDAGTRHLKAFFQGKGQNEHEKITQDRIDSTAKYQSRFEMRDVDTTVQKVEQQVTGYKTRVLCTVTEVTGVTERVVGTRALQGGVPVIELLTAVGLGTEKYCTATGDGKSAAEFVAAEWDRVRLILDREKPQLETLLQQGTAAEPAIAELLNRALIS